jgi:transposase-like protein
LESGWQSWQVIQIKRQINLECILYTADMDENSARELLEKLRWPETPMCPHCGAAAGDRVRRLVSRPSVFQCNECRRQFTVTVGTALEETRVGLPVWIEAVGVLCAEPGISGERLGSAAGVSYKTARSLAARIRRSLAGAEAATPEAVLRILLQSPPVRDSSKLDGLEEVVRLLKDKRAAG